MMLGRHSGIAGVVLVLVLAALAQAQWNSVAPGIEYREFTVSGPNNLFVARMDRSVPDAYIESSIAQGRLSSGRETVSGMANRYEDSLGYWDEEWGHRADVVVAINGDFFNGTTGVPTSGQIQSGWYAKRFSDFTGGSGFALKLSGGVFIGECVNHKNAKQLVQYVATGQTQKIKGTNVPPPDHSMTVYTPQYGPTTGTPDTVSEVLVKLDQPMLIKPLAAYVRGVVRKQRPNQGSSEIPFDHVVLVADGDGASKLLANAPVGAEIRISQEITDLDETCSVSGLRDWTKTYAAIGGSFYFLKSGVVQTFTDPGATERHPRTAIAYNSSYVFFIVCDGRDPGVSVGMNMTELGNFCLTYLSATDGCNQDGGGSSAIWVNGVIKNNPSDGSERAVANGMMMCRVQPRETSSTFDVGYDVRTTGSTNLRQGPGLNMNVLTALTGAQEGTVWPHAFNGIRASGYHWWRCDFSGATGWVAESQLTLVSAPAADGDFDHDGDVDLSDYGTFLFCYNGPGLPYPVEGCVVADFDEDGDVDLSDYGVFLGCYNGPTMTPACLP